MNNSNINLLHCIECGNSLSLSMNYYCQSTDDNIEFGVLTCNDCNSHYPIIDGVGVFFLKDMAGHYLNQYEKKIVKKLGLSYDGELNVLSVEQRKQLDVAKNWSYQWNKVYCYSKKDFKTEGFLSEDLFFKFIPIEPSDLKNRNIIIWCGGKGREAYHIAKYTPELLIVNEIGDEIYGINELINNNIDLLLIRCDITNNPLNDGIADYSICDHALQHTADHNTAFKKILNVSKVGGNIAINVYSHECNFLMTHIVEHLKIILHKLPIGIQRNISIVPAIIIYFFIHFIYVPAKRIFPERTFKKLPLSDHMIFWSKISFKWIWLACFDLIHAPISYHFRKNEIEEMANRNKVIVNKLIHTNGTTWSLIGQKTSK